MGVPTSRLSTELSDSINALFNSSIGKFWAGTPWLETSPYGEARFLGNRLTYPNDLSKTANWTATAVTVTANSVFNPADGATTACKMLETTANSAHKVVQAVATFYPSTEYLVSFYARPILRDYQYLSVTDGVTTYTAFFNTTTGVVGTTANFTAVTMAKQPNGFWLCKATFTANAAATASGSVSIQSSSDGATLSYAGTATKGAYFWGCLVQQTSNVPVQDSVLPWDQTGENAIDSIFNVWACSPHASNYPRSLGYNLTPTGIQIINGAPYSYGNYAGGVAQTNIYGAAQPNPIYIYYGKTAPSFTGSVYSATATYAVDGQAYFTTSTGYGDFYKCIVATTAGQSPDTTPASWEVIPLYDVFLSPCLYQTFGDWLISDGQMEKAAGAYSIAESRLGDALDQNERVMGVIPVLKVSTHLTSRSTR
jgi:hypothetical protein